MGTEAGAGTMFKQWITSLRRMLARRNDRAMTQQVLRDNADRLARLNGRAARPNETIVPAKWARP